jgi:hypothetical protein
VWPVKPIWRLTGVMRPAISMKISRQQRFAWWNWDSGMGLKRPTRPNPATSQHPPIVRCAGSGTAEKSWEGPDRTKLRSIAAVAALPFGRRPPSLIAAVASPRLDDPNF